MSTTVTIASDRGDPNPEQRANQVERVKSEPPVRDKERFLYDTVLHIDSDEDLQFQLRGHSLNPLVDAAQPLLGLVIRLRRMDSCSDVARLYVNVRDQITALSEEVRHLGYDSATQLAYRYALCAFVDEAVMTTTWGSSSVWRERSLLSYHHNETWGGEKFFTVLVRMQMDPAKYRDVLEFKYLCLCLGFQGKYGGQLNSQDTLNTLIAQLHQTLRTLRGDAPERLTDAPANVASRRYRLGRQWPLWTPWALALAALTGAYVYYSVRLGSTTDLVLQSLEGILKP